MYNDWNIKLYETTAVEFVEVKSLYASGTYNAIFVVFTISCKPHHLDWFI
jgi:hypothetical protein